MLDRSRTCIGPYSFIVLDGDDGKDVDFDLSGQIVRIMNEARDARDEVMQHRVTGIELELVV